MRNKNPKQQIMKATISLEGLWSFLQSLSLDNNNKQWLADKLQEDIRKTDQKTIEENDDKLFNSLAGCWGNCPEMDDVEDVIKKSRTNGVTRNIVSFTD